MFGSFLPSDTPRQTRRAHNKSRAGCITCKQRKIKCDEAKPVCGNCFRHFVDVQSCQYDVPISTRPRPLAAKPRQLAATPATQSSPEVENRSGDLNASRFLEAPLPESVSAERLDPFETYPESRVVGVDELMKYYLRSALYEYFPWQPASETNPTAKFYVPLVFSDPVLFHAILRLSSIRLKKARSQNAGHDYTQLSAECIRLLRDRIENAGNAVSSSDETISAVAILAAIEHESGNLRMVRMHLEGLKRMLDIRGGLMPIRQTNPMVANSVFWSFAVALYEVPYPKFDPILPPFFPSDHGLFSSRTSEVISHFQDFGPQYESSQALELQSLGVKQNIAAVANSVQHISQLIPTHSYPTATTSLVILTRMCNILSYLLSMDQIAPSSPIDMEALISESMRLSTLLHVFTPWRGLAPDGTITINLLLHQLINSLKLILSAPNFSPNMAILWIFCTGAVAADKMPERKWFVSHLVEIAEDMNISTWEGMKAIVSKVIWHDRLCTHPYTKLWGEMEKSKNLVGI